MRRLLIPASLLLLAFASCKKDDDNKTPGKPEELLLGDWLTTAITTSIPHDNGNGLTTDGFAHYKPCERDDYVTFKSDGTFEINEGETKCSSGEPQITYGVYVLSYPYITMDNLQTLTIKQLDNSTMKLQIVIPANPGMDTITSTFKRK